MDVPDPRIVSFIVDFLSFKRELAILASEMKIFVTGATGFIGSTLVERLVADGLFVKALIRRGSDRKFLKSVETKIEIVEGSLFDKDALENGVADCDVVFHLAGVVAAPSEGAFYKSNVLGTQNLIDAINSKASRLKQFVLVSSLAAGGPGQTENPRLETDKDEPVSAYGKSKLQAETVVRKRLRGIPIKIIRPPIVFGPRDSGVLTMIKPVLNGFMPLIRGRTLSGNKYYSVIFVNDLVDALIELLKVQKNSDFEIYYLSDGAVYTFREILQSVANVKNSRPVVIMIPFFLVRIMALLSEVIGRLFKFPVPLNRDKLNEIYADYWVCSGTKFLKEYDFNPKNDLQLGMKKTIEWYEKEGWI